eukprot:1287279-Prymnesium_polylepis.1
MPLEWATIIGKAIALQYRVLLPFRRARACVSKRSQNDQLKQYVTLVTRLEITSFKALGSRRAPLGRHAHPPVVRSLATAPPNGCTGGWHGVHQ